MGDFDPRGVNPQLVRNVRAALDAEGFGHVRITASGGFDPAKIHRFESEGVPVDSYGVGSSLFAGRLDFTGDIVEVDGRPVGKQGRRSRPNPRLERVE
jgi:nicotinate phosphoribosyltransferase